MLVVLDDKLDDRLRQHVQTRYKSRTYGMLSTVINEAVEQYLARKANGGEAKN